MFKKVISLLLSAALVFLFTACSGEQTEGETETIDGTEIAEEQNADAGASMDMVTDDTEFAGKLGMTIDTSLIPVENVARYVEDGGIAYFCFGVGDDPENPATVLLRATKDPELKDSLSEFNENATSLEDTEICGVKVSRKEAVDMELVYRQYEFEKDGIYYCLMTIGNISDETFTELFASFLEAVRPAE